MKISKNTLNILKNFAGINTSLKFKKGSLIKTVSPEMIIFAKATVEEDFPREFAIYDLYNFLSAIELLEEPEFDFTEDKVAIRSKNRTLDYFYCDVDLEAQKKKVLMAAEDVTFTLSKQDFSALVNAAGIVESKFIAINSSGSEVHLSVLDEDKPLAPTFDIALPETSNRAFKAVFNVDNLKILPGSYTVTVSFDDGVAHFKNQNASLEYWIMAESQSNFPGA